MTKPNAFLCLPFEFKGKCQIYPPTVNQVVKEQFDIYYSVLVITQEDLDDELTGLKDENGEAIYIPTPLEYLLANCYHSEDFYKTFKAAFQFFIHEDVSCLWEAKSLLIGDLEEEVQKAEDVTQLRLITEDDFFDFQNLIRICCGREKYQSPEDLSTLHPKIREMKKKARERDKVKAKQDAKKAPDLETTLASICCMGIGLTPLNIGEISYAAVSKLIETNQKREKYDLDCRSLLMGADPKKIKLEYWIRNTDEK